MASLFGDIIWMADVANAKNMLTASTSEDWKRLPGCLWIRILRRVQDDLMSHSVVLTEAVSMDREQPLWRLLAMTIWKLVNQQYLPHMSLQYRNFGLLSAEIVSLVWGTPANFNRFRVLAALLHGTQVVGIIQTLRHWTEGATYIRQGGHHVGHWPTF